MSLVRISECAFQIGGSTSYRKGSANDRRNEAPSRFNPRSTIRTKPDARFQPTVKRMLGVHDSTQPGRRAMCVTARNGGGQSMNRNLAPKEHQKLSIEIALLESLDVYELRARWRVLYETEAPTRFSQDLLMRAVAYRLQERLLRRSENLPRGGC